MPLLLLIWSNKRWTLIIVLIISILLQLVQTNKLSGDLAKAKNECQNRIEKATQPYKEAAAAAQAEANKVSQTYEETKQAERVRTETIIKEVEKIVERPVYRNVCLDVDGLSAINQGITGKLTSEP